MNALVHVWIEPGLPAALGALLWNTNEMWRRVPRLLRHVHIHPHAHTV